MVVGRFVAGLLFESPNFAILPPGFETIDDTVNRGVEMRFPAAPPVMQPTCSFFLTSLVYHAEYLKTNLHPPDFHFPLISRSEFANCTERTSHVLLSLRKSFDSPHWHSA